MRFTPIARVLAALTEVRDLAAEDARVLLCKSRPLPSGRGECRVPNAPAAWMTLVDTPTFHDDPPSD
jgi:hypothetical protein